MNKIILAVILAGFGTQFLKLVVIWFKHKRLEWHDLVVTGGMPSSHSAFVVSLGTIIFLEEGVSTAFAVSLVLALIVIRDAFGVRRTVGNEAKEIEKLLRLHKIRSRFHYAIGHTPTQVLVGGLIGFLIAMGVYLI
jgi:acid phosphatase family membrane protein YuiD